jgi:hypothetical protein
MSRRRSTGTSVYTRQHSRNPTLPQLSAINLLVSGKNDRETAELLNLSRTCVTKWRLYDPVFQAALNVRRAEVWSVGAARLAGLIPKALDALSAELDKPDSPNRLKAAVELLRLVPVPISPVGRIDPEAIVRQRVAERYKEILEDRARANEREDNEPLDTLNGLPAMPSDEEITVAIIKEIDTRLNDPEPDSTTDLIPTSETSESGGATV